MGSTANTNRFSAPRGGITWGTHTTGGLTVPVTAPRKRSASTEQVPKIRKPNERVEEEDEDDATFTRYEGEAEEDFLASKKALTAIELTLRETEEAL